MPRATSIREVDELRQVGTIRPHRVRTESPLRDEVLRKSIDGAVQVHVIMVVQFGGCTRDRGSVSRMTLALVTGATAGIGAEYARQLAARGMDLVLVARDVDRLQALAATLTDQHGIAVEVLPADLLDEEQCARVERRVAASDHPVDYLVNNAGFGLAQQFDEASIGDELRQFDLLARVPLRLIHAALSQMLPRRSGTIVTVSSSAAFGPLGSYSAAKAWSISFSRWANAYYRSSGVAVSAVAPGFVRTEFHERMKVSRESMAPNALWMNVDTLVRQALRDVDRGKAISVPTLRYKVIVGVMGIGRPIISALVARQGTASRRR